MKEILANSTNFSARANGLIKYIVIHYTANDGDTAQSNCKFFQAPNRNASAHYFVDENEVCRSVLDVNKAWHCGSENGSYVHKDARNENSIGIEMCSRKDSNGEYYFKDGTITNAVALVKDLMKKYNIPISNVIRHYDVTGKLCPKPLVDNNAWKRFIEKVKEDDEVVTKTKMLVNGKEVEVNTILKDGKNYIELRTVAETLGYKVEYDANKKMPIISK